MPQHSPLFLRGMVAGGFASLCFLAAALLVVSALAHTDQASVVGGGLFVAALYFSAGVLILARRLRLAGFLALDALALTLTSAALPFATGATTIGESGQSCSSVCRPGGAIVLATAALAVVGAGLIAEAVQHGRIWLALAIILLGLGVGAVALVGQNVDGLLLAAPEVVLAAAFVVVGLAGS